MTFDQISIVSPVNDSSRQVAVSLLNDLRTFNGDHNTYINFTMSTNITERKEIYQLDDELEQIQLEASTLFTAKCK